MASLEIEIEQNATVAQCQISLLRQIGADNSPEGKDANSGHREGGSDDSACKIQFLITGGNVFHPNAKISIIPPSSPTTTVALKIGPNNLFEEECNVILDLSSIGGGGGDNENDDNNDNPPITMIGSYNHFAARCQVHIQATRTMGNANIFNPKCKILLTTSGSSHGEDDGGSLSTSNYSHIKNGNLIQSSCCVRMNTSPIRSSTNSGDEIDNGLQEAICYNLIQPHAMTSGARLVIRGNPNGVKKNIQEVSQLLGVSRIIVQKHHKLLESSS